MTDMSTVSFKELIKLFLWALRGNQLGYTIAPAKLLTVCLGGTINLVTQ